MQSFNNTEKSDTSKNQVQFEAFISEINESSSGVSTCHIHEGLLWGILFELDNRSIQFVVA